MRGKPKKPPREKDLTSRYLSGGLDEDRIDSVQRFTERSKHHQANKTARTSQMRADAAGATGDLDTLPIGQVVQFYSQFCDIDSAGQHWFCTIPKTLASVARRDLVVGDLVRFRANGRMHETGKPEATIEQILPRTTVLTRADSFKQIVSHPIVANASQMLIVASVKEPNIKWGLIDRMIIAAQSGGLVPIICLNKIDLADAPEHLDHYRTLGLRALRTSAVQGVGIDELRDLLKDQTTVLAGHSGVGKSSLIRAVQPSLDLRIGHISGYTGKGIHTTTSARRYALDVGGYVIDTPGVKLFGLWAVTRENLLSYFPDVEADAAPKRRIDSYARILSSLPGDSDA